MLSNWRKFGLLLILTASCVCAFAQNTANGQLNVTFTWQQGIALYIETDTTNGGVALAPSSGSSTPTMDLGDIFAFGTLPVAGITRTVDTVNSQFTVSTRFVTDCTKYGSTSASYRLAVTMASNPTPLTLKLDGNTLVAGTPVTLGTTYQYNGTSKTNYSHTLDLVIPFAASAQSITNTLNFVATAN